MFKESLHHGQSAAKSDEVPNFLRSDIPVRSARNTQAIVGKYRTVARSEYVGSGIRRMVSYLNTADDQQLKAFLIVTDEKSNELRQSLPYVGMLD